MIRKIVWGMFFLAAAALVVMNSFGLLDEVGVIGDILGGTSFWGFLIAVCMAAVVIESLLQINFFGICFGLAGLVIVFARPLGLQALSPWPALLVALLLSIGLSLIFGPRYLSRLRFRGTSAQFAGVREYIDDNEVFSDTTYGSSTKFLKSKSLKKAVFRLSIGSLKVYFDDAVLAPEGAQVHIDVNMGGVELFVPGSWKVVNRVVAMAGKVEHRDIGEEAADAPVLTVTGNVSLGSLEIKRI